MPRYFPQLLLILSLWTVPKSLAANSVAKNELVVYCYDSFAAKGSLGEVIASHFGKSSSIKTRLVVFPSAGEALNQIALEGKKTRADLIVGIDASLLARARSLEAFVKNKASDFPDAPKEFQFDSELAFVPFDYGYLAVLYDDRRLPEAKVPKSLAALAESSDLRKKLVIQDPRTSSIGLSFLTWTNLVFPGKAEAYWRDLARQIVTVSPGWSGAYGLFMKKEADLVVSYTTSPAYHIIKENDSHIHAAIFPEGHLRQIEGVGIVKHSKHKDAAKKWIQALLSTEVQQALPTAQWMYPVSKKVTLDATFAALVVPKAIDPSATDIEKSKKSWLGEWVSAMSRPSR